MSGRNIGTQMKGIEKGKERGRESEEKNAKEEINHGKDKRKAKGMRVMSKNRMEDNRKREREREREREIRKVCGDKGGGKMMRKLCWVEAVEQKGWKASEWRESLGERPSITIIL